MKDVTALIDLWLGQIGAQTERLGDRDWTVRVPCVKREIIAVSLHANERTLSLRAFFMRGPDRAQEDVYRRVLGKNLEMRIWRFAIDDSGDLWLVADADISSLGSDGLDGVLGLLSTYVDECFEGVLRMGFAVSPDMQVTGAPPDARGA